MRKMTLSEPGTSSGTARGAAALTLAWDLGQPATVPSFLGFGQGLPVSSKNGLCVPWAEVIISDNVAPGTEATHDLATSLALAPGSSASRRPFFQKRSCLQATETMLPHLLCLGLLGQASGDSHQASSAVGSRSADSRLDLGLGVEISVAAAFPGSSSPEGGLGAKTWPTPEPLSGGQDFI